MARTVRITLGELTFEAEAFDVGQAEEIVAAIDTITTTDTALQAKVAASRDIVFAAARAANPSLTMAEFRALKAFPVDILAAATAILKHCGFVRAENVGKAAAGEAGAPGSISN